MSFSNRPEQMRGRPCGSRCCGSMFAWILNYETGKGLVRRLHQALALCRGPARRASFVKASRNGPTPKLVSALPKNTGVVAGRSGLERSNEVPAPVKSPISPAAGHRRRPASASFGFGKASTVIGQRDVGVRGALEEQDLAVLKIVHALENRILRRWAN